ncbi:MAG: hypothetical protein HFG69_07315 [Hungatella sp.]|nr:hypothetical protein [Hungatella sp.]
MKTYDFTPLKNNDTEYQKITDSVSERYKGDWDDRIHDSYLRYVKQTEELSLKVHIIRCKAETLEKEAEGLKIEELQRKADSLCREADAI